MEKRLLIFVLHWKDLICTLIHLSQNTWDGSKLEWQKNHRKSHIAERGGCSWCCRASHLLWVRRGQRMCEWMDGFIRGLFSFQDGLTFCQNCTEQHQVQGKPLVCRGKGCEYMEGPLLPTAVLSMSMAHISTCWTSISGGKGIHSALLKTQCAQCICVWWSLVFSLSSPQLNWKVWSRVLCRKLVFFASKSQKFSSLFTGWQKYTHFPKKIFALERDYYQSNEYLPSLGRGLCGAWPCGRMQVQAHCQHISLTSNLKYFMFLLSLPWCDPTSLVSVSCLLSLLVNG